MAPRRMPAAYQVSQSIISAGQPEKSQEVVNPRYEQALFCLISIAGNSVTKKTRAQLKLGFSKRGEYA